MKHLFIFFFLFLTACSSGTNENSIQTAIAETQAFENKIDTSLVETQQAIPTNTPTKIPTPTITPDPCSDEIIEDWFMEVFPIAFEFLGIYEEFKDFPADQKIPVADLNAYLEDVAYFASALKKIDTPQCAEKAVEYHYDACLAFSKAVFYYKEDVDFNVIRYTEEVIDFLEKFGVELIKLEVWE